MAKIELQPITHHEVYKPRGEKLVATYAGKHVREYDSHDPRLVIDLIQNGEYQGKIIADNFTLFETGISTRLDTVELIRGHHKARLVFAIGKSSFDTEGSVKHEVYSPDGIVGYARGDNLDFYLASLLYEDPNIRQKALTGWGSFDKSVQQYIEEELSLPGIFKKAVQSPEFKFKELVFRQSQPFSAKCP